jgi:hypothetical protein
MLRKRSPWKQEVILEAKHEIKNLILKEMTLKSEVNMLRKRSLWRQEVILEPSTRSRTLSFGDDSQVKGKYA